MLRLPTTTGESGTTPQKPRKERGQSLVEFALVLPLLVVFLLAILDFAWVLRSYVTITNAGREGARYGVTCKTDADIQSRVVDLSSNLLSTSDVSVAFTPSGNPCASGTYPSNPPLDAKVEVEVTYTYQWITPLAGMANMLSGGVIPSDLTLTSKSIMRFE
jgi:Flp pilus assembly protein TadG